MSKNLVCGLIVAMFFVLALCADPIEGARISLTIAFVWLAAAVVST